MTIEEALDHLYTYSSTLGSGQTTQAQHEEAKRVAIDVMRKYQKQERALDKIRSEIEQDAFKDVNGSKYIFVNRVNQILDKYKGEVRKRNEF